MNLAGQSASGSPHQLPLVPFDACSMLMHADDRSVDHLDGRIVGRGERVNDPALDARPAPTDETIVAGGEGAKAPGRSRQGAPERRTQKMPLSTRRSLTRGTPRGLLGSIGLMAVHS